ncbi:hypothetical protein ACLOJK_008525 [Asimina triloba]
MSTHLTQWRSFVRKGDFMPRERDRESSRAASKEKTTGLILCGSSTKGSFANCPPCQEDLQNTPLPLSLRCWAASRPSPALDPVLFDTNLVRGPSTGQAQVKAQLSTSNDKTVDGGKWTTVTEGRARSQGLGGAQKCKAIPGAPTWRTDLSRQPSDGADDSVPPMDEWHNLIPSYYL